jgi:hypothetical protein
MLEFVSDVVYLVFTTLVTVETLTGTSWLQDDQRLLSCMVAMLWDCLLNLPPVGKCMQVAGWFVKTYICLFGFHLLSVNPEHMPRSLNLINSALKVLFPFWEMPVLWCRHSSASLEEVLSSNSKTLSSLSSSIIHPA